MLYYLIYDDTEEGAGTGCVICPEDEELPVFSYRLSKPNRCLYRMQAPFDLQPLISF